MIKVFYKYLFHSLFICSSLLLHLYLVFIYYEKDQQNAMSIYYGKANKNKNEKKIKLCKTFLRVIYPTFSIVFIVLFWIVGLVQYYKQA